MNINQMTTTESIKAKARAYNVEKAQGFHKQGKASFGLPVAYAGKVFVSNSTMASLELAAKEG